MPDHKLASLFHFLRPDMFQAGYSSDCEHLSFQLPDNSLHEKMNCSICFPIISSSANPE
jgi:hypothetical protein